MSETPEWGRADKLQALEETRQKLEVIEREWKHWRDQSKNLTLDLITEHGLSISKAAQLSGHHRNTITVWLQVHNAEQKALKKSRD